MKVSSIIASFSLLAATAYAQANKSPAVTSNGTVLSVFLFHNHCDRTSLILPDGSQGGTFGAGGATMCFQDGAYYWNKYLRKDAPLKIYGTSQIFNSDYVNAEVPNMDLSIQSGNNWTSGDLTEDLRDVGGRLMAGKIARTFREQLASPGGWSNKFNFVLGGYDIMLSFFAIANLPSRSPDFFGLPDLGSSMVFELYTDDETVGTDHIVDQQSIKVAFGFRNGTTVDDTLTYWPLFDQDDGEFGMPYEEFLAKLDEVAVRSVGQWCSVCSAKLDFCQGTGPANPPTGSNTDGENDEQSSAQRHGMAPAVAGVIGAIIMLAIVGIVAAFAFFVFGVGVRRERRRSSVLSGIGSIGRSQPKEKLESDIELPLSPTAQPLPRGFGEDNEFEYGTASTVATKVASPLASPQEAHFKAWESRL
ncbi:hypothetical protein TWF594_008966 [Orbilia oligospora]|nr:hypothetical protein TWF594_008966 [Orbilia oligospora]